MQSIVDGNLFASSELWKDYLQEKNDLIYRVNDLLRSGNGSEHEDSTYSIYSGIFKNRKEFQFKVNETDFFLKREIFKKLKNIDYWDEELERSIKEHDEFKIAKALDGIADVFFYKLKDDTAMLLYNKELELYEKLNKQTDIGYLLLKIGEVYNFQGLYIPALVTFKLAIEKMSKSGDKKHLVNALNGVGNLFIQLEAPELAKEYLNRAWKISDRITDKTYMANTCFYLSKYYETKKNYIKATSYLLQVFDSSFENDKIIKAYTCYRLGNNYSSLNNIDFSKHYYLKSIDLANSQNCNKLIIANSTKLGEIFKNEGNIIEALKYLEASWMLIKNTDDYKNKEYIASLLNEIYKAKGEYRIAYDYLVFKDEAKDSLIDIYKKNIGAKDKYWMSYARQYKKERSNEEECELSKQHKKNIILIGCVFNILVLFVLIILLIKKDRIKKQNNTILLLKNETIISQNKQLKKANKKLTESEKDLNELNQTKDKFFSIIAHDLKSPLNEIIRLFEIVTDPMTCLDQDKFNAYIKNIFGSMKSMYNFLDNLLQWSQSQCNLVTITPRKYYLEDIVNPVISLLDSILKKKNVILFNLVRKEHTVYVDYSMMALVLRNIVYNAIKYTPENKNIYIESVYKSGFVRIIVRDEGIGIPEDKQELIFRMDKKFRSKGTNGEAGSGLGLILCKEFVEKNKGVIGVKSVIGEGSSFWIKVPYKEGIFLERYI